MMNYLSKHSLNLAEIGTSIYSLMGKNCEWYWSSEQQKAFDEAKAKLSLAPVSLSILHVVRDIVSADASQFVIGAVLLQSSDGVDWQPIAYMSRKFKEVEKHYAMLEKEALFITWACKKFDYHLVGRTFEIETNHRPLISLLGEKDFSQLPIWAQRYKLRLMHYD